MTAMTSMAAGWARGLRGLILAGLGTAAWQPVTGVGAAPAKLELRVEGISQVKRHERIDFRLNLETGYDNPYNPMEIAVEVEVVPPSGRKVVVPAFYFQPHEWQRVRRGGRESDWIYPAGEPVWEARFAPSELGRHSAVATARDRRGERRSAACEFTCVEGASKGCVRVSQTDPRFLQFEDGTPFYPLGLNLAFVGSGQYLDVEGVSKAFGKLAAAGGNYARVWVCAEDWALGIEARKSAWGRSWDWRPPLTVMPGREGYHGDELCLQLGGGFGEQIQVSPAHPVALRPGTRYRLQGLVLSEGDDGVWVEMGGAEPGEEIKSQRRGEWLKWERVFTTGTDQWWLGTLSVRVAQGSRAWLRDLSLREAEGGPELLWEAAVNRPARGRYNQLDSAMLDRVTEAAESAGIYLQLCLLTRDHYMSSLGNPKSPAYEKAIADAQKLLRYAVARWGYSTHVAAWEYFNEMNPGLSTADFYRELGEWLARIDWQGHLRTTSAWGPAPDDWAHPQLDVANLHWYLRPAWGEIWKDEVASVLDRAKLMRERVPDKPALLAEFGLADDRWGLSPYMKQDRENIHFHNSQWASAFAGLSGGALFWWWETLDQNDAYGQYRPLADFLVGIPFASARLQARVMESGQKQCRVLAWQGADRLYAWLFNPGATWWKQVGDKQTPAEVREDWLGLDGLQDGAYEVEWWDTWQGQVLSQVKTQADGRSLRVSIPPFLRDLAVKAVRREAAH